jgi:mono/diheme cytochrome c family protein
MIPGYRTLLICVLSVFFIPIATRAQDNHCVAQKSPIRMAYAAGKPVYVANCQNCHQEDGSGLNNGNPSLIKSQQVLGDKDALIEYLLVGRPAAATEKKYALPMPTYPVMTDDDMANLLTYIRRSFGNKASLVKPSDVKSVREKLVKK